MAEESHSVFDDPKATDEARQEGRIKKVYRKIVRTCKACCGLKSK